MLTVTQNGPNRIDLELSGKLDKATMKIALDEIITKSEGIQHGKMLYRIHDLNLPTLGALGVEIARLPTLFKTIKGFDRVAVITDKKWLRKASEFEGALIPGLDIKAFAAEGETDAEAWLLSESAVAEH
ncbi:MAG: STAS/SEC14 domain-containing protein [Ketobacter sp.]|nr:MAG: STAS/SEC14 domain-containing protein [Ketobacter sp.]